MPRSRSKLQWVWKWASSQVVLKWRWVSQWGNSTSDTLYKLAYLLEDLLGCSRIHSCLRIFVRVSVVHALKYDGFHAAFDVQLSTSLGMGAYAVQGKQQSAVIRQVPCVAGQDWARSLQWCSLHMLSKHSVLSCSINSADLLRPARRLLKTIVRNVRQQTAVHGQEAKSYFLSFKNMMGVLDVLSLNQTRGFPGRRVTFPPAMAAIRSEWRLWDGHEEEKRKPSVPHSPSSSAAGQFSHCESLITYTKVTACILLTQIYKRSTQNKKLFKWRVFFSRWSLSPSCNPPFHRRKYSRALMHLFCWFFTFKVMGFCRWRQFAKTPITAPTLHTFGILKSL